MMAPELRNLEETDMEFSENAFWEEEDEFRSCSAEDDDWSDAEEFIGDDFVKKSIHGFEDLDCSAKVEGYSKLYFKGVSIGPGLDGVSAIGIVLHDSSKDFSVQVQKKLDFYVEESVVEHLALLDGLLAAIKNGMQRISAFTDSEIVYDQIGKSKEAKDQLLVALKHRILELSSKLEAFVLELVPRSNLKTPLKLAREAIGVDDLSVDGLLGDSDCPICCEEKQSWQLISMSCFHKFCTRCMIKYVKGRLKSAQLPIRCPQIRCKHYISTMELKSFLPIGYYQSFLRLLLEENILNMDGFCCPFPNCSFMLGTNHVLSIDASSSNWTEMGTNCCIQCPECKRSFCISCGVEWHLSLSCSEYQGLHVGGEGYHNLDLDEREIGDITLHELVQSNNWTRCQQCGQMIELTHGCYHMVCWCGHEFCFACGSEYRDNQRTCQCIYWDEDNTTSSDSQESESWSCSYFNVNPALPDTYTEYEISQLALIQKFLDGGFDLGDLPCQPSPQAKKDSYVDTIKELPWLERFVSVISDSYDDYVTQ